jgi:hypothetical protein
MFFEEPNTEETIQEVNWTILKLIARELKCRCLVD